MFSKNQECYWDNLDDIDDEWRQILDDEYEIMKEEHNEYDNWLPRICRTAFFIY